MKKVLLSSVLAISIMIGYQSSFNKANSHSAGETSATSGNPQASGSTCANCHGEAVSNLPNGGFVITQIGSSTPITSYKADTTYNVKLSYTGSGAARHGFQATCEKTSGGFAGSFTAGTGNKVVSTNYITHSSAPSITSPNWSFTWTAPASGSGSVTLYGVIRKDNSAIYKTTTTLTETVTGGGSGINSMNTLHAVVYPNLVSNELNITTCTTDKCVINIFSLNGTLVKQFETINANNTFNVTDLNAGIYLVKISANSKSSTIKLVKQ
jgi:hypothetical protein